MAGVRRFIVAVLFFANVVETRNCGWFRRYRSLSNERSFVLLLWIVFFSPPPLVVVVTVESVTIRRNGFGGLRTACAKAVGDCGDGEDEEEGKDCCVGVDQTAFSIPVPPG